MIPVIVRPLQELQQQVAGEIQALDSQIDNVTSSEAERLHLFEQSAALDEAFQAIGRSIRYRMEALKSTIKEPGGE